MVEAKRYNFPSLTLLFPYSWLWLLCDDEDIEEDILPSLSHSPTILAVENVADSLNNVNVAVTPATSGNNMYNLAHTLPQLSTAASGTVGGTVAGGTVGGINAPLTHTNMGLTDSDVITANQQQVSPVFHDLCVCIE